MNFKLIEPLKDFFKDEVRVLGNSLGLTKIFALDILFRTWLSNKNSWKITREKIKILQDADNIFIDELNKSKLYNKIGSLCSFITIKNSRCHRWLRTYEYTCLLRAVTSEDE